MKIESKENFCGACLAVPLALAGVGVAGSGTKKTNKTTKKILLIGGITITILSIIVAIMYLRSCKSCN